MGNKNDQLDSILQVIGGEKEFKVGVETNQIILIVSLLTIGIFVSTFAAIKLAK